MTLPFGIDLSKHQGTNDYAKMRANTSFVLVKATESWGYTDPMFYRNWTGLIGHNRGAYCYVWLSDDPLRQANHLIDIVTQAGVDWRYDRLVLDLEKSGHGLSKAEVSRRVLVMMERIKEITGRYPILYSRAIWVNDNMLITDQRLVNADWWLATYRKTNPEPQYTPEAEPPPYLPKGVNRWLIHQTSSHENGKRFGVGSYYVDTNRFNGTKVELDNYFGLGEVVPPAMPPEPELPVEKPLYRAKVTTTFPNRLRVRRTPNGVFVRWLISGEQVDVWQETTGWARIGIGEWVSTDWIQRLPDEDLIADGLMDVQLWSQRDPRWANDRMGASYITLGQEGCLVTCTASLLNFLDIKVDPKTYNALLTARSGYAPPNLMYWKMPDVIWKGEVERAEYSGWFTGGKGWESFADAILESGRPALAHVDFVPGGAVNQHWVLLIGKIDGVWWCYDPWYGAVSALNARYNGIYRIVSYRRVR